jgi:RimJ/RimL family protein N-acetyltransferase
MLRQLAMVDAPLMLEYRSDPGVCRYQSFEPGTIADVERFISELLPIEFGVPGTWFQFAIQHRESGHLVGDIGAHFAENDARQVEIGFTVSPAFQRRGFGLESVSGLVGHLFEHCAVHRVYASVDPRNRPSVQLLRRAGFREEGHFRESLWFKGEWVDDMVFGLLSSEWRSR